MNKYRSVDSYVHCPVVKQARSGQSMKEVEVETRDVVECFSLLVKCFTTEQRTVKASIFVS